MTVSPTARLGRVIRAEPVAELVARTRPIDIARQLGSAEGPQRERPELRLAAGGRHTGRLREAVQRHRRLRCVRLRPGGLRPGEAHAAGVLAQGHRHGHDGLSDVCPVPQFPHPPRDRQVQQRLLGGLPLFCHCLSLPFTALSLPFTVFSLPFTALSLFSHCPFTALPLPFRQVQQRFLDESHDQAVVPDEHARRGQHWLEQVEAEDEQDVDARREPRATDGKAHAQHGQNTW